MNKSVIITGGTSGIGLATAAYFLKHRDKVLIAGRNDEASYITGVVLPVDGGYSTI